MVNDLAQLSRGTCRENDIAVSVLATVIGHQRGGPNLVLDAGALALSKDIGANRFMNDAHYGWVCTADTLERCGSLSVETVHQEHGTVPVRSRRELVRPTTDRQPGPNPAEPCLPDRCGIRRL